MIIIQKRVRSLRRFDHLNGTDVRFGVDDIERFGIRRLRKIGFKDLLPGEMVLPAPLGPVSRRNSAGDYIKHRDRPMETVTRQVEWTRQQWIGRGMTEEVTDFVDVPYQRYPRTFIPPESIELQVIENSAGKKMIVSPTMSYNDENRKTILNIMNLFLELFGEFQVLNAEAEYRIPSVRRLNWEVIPEGKAISWEGLRDILAPIIETRKPNVRPVIERRLEFLHTYSPDVIAVGLSGFRGYIVFGYERLGIFVLESTQIDNATYVLGEDWKEISRLTKAEILQSNRHLDRMIHSNAWERQVSRLLEPSGRS